MARNKKGGLQYGAQILAGAAIMYFLLDFPIRFTQAYDFPVCILGQRRRVEIAYYSIGSYPA